MPQINCTTIEDTTSGRLMLISNDREQNAFATRSYLYLKICTSDMLKHPENYPKPMVEALADLRRQVYQDILGKNEEPMTISEIVATLARLGWVSTETGEPTLKITES